MKRNEKGQFPKLSHEDVKSLFEKEGCVLLDKYKNARTKMRYICSCGRESLIVLYSFKMGNRCRRCGISKLSDAQRIKKEEAMLRIKSKKLKALGEYVDVKTKMHLRCIECGQDFFHSINRLGRFKKCNHTGPNNRPKGSLAYQWNPDRKHIERSNIFRQKCYKILRCSLKRCKKIKNDSTISLLGYSYLQLKDHIENHENWSNVKDGKWSIDHIFPIQAFIDYEIYDLKLINCLENLQPLTLKENSSKKDNYDTLQFEKWLDTKGYLYESKLK